MPFLCWAVSWHILWFGIPGHFLADFAGVCNAMLHPSQKPTVLGPCYLCIVILVALCWGFLGFLAGALVFTEIWLMGIPEAHFRTLRDLDKISLSQE